MLSAGIRTFIVAISVAQFSWGIPAHADDHEKELTETDFMRQALWGAMREAEQAGNRAVLLIGGREPYMFDTVFCVPGMFEIAIASDRQKRPRYPEVKISLVDTESASSNSNSIAIMFNHREDRELWELREGEIDKVNGQIEAVGYLRGLAMTENADGTLSPAPLDGEERVVFSAAIRCD